MRIFQNVWSFFAFSILGFGCLLSAEIFAQVQDFESNFEIVNHPEEFLPFWSANEVRSTAARVFQANGEGRNGSRALGVQPISTFDGEIHTSYDLSGFDAPKIALFAKTRQNGSGNRPATVFISFGKEIGNYGQAVQIGDNNTFPNQHTDYKLYELGVPVEYWNNRVFIKIEVKYGPGVGSAARFFLDDFGFYEVEEQVDPIKVVEARLLNPFELYLSFDRPIIPFEQTQISFSSPKVSGLYFPVDYEAVIEFESEVLSGILNLQLVDLEAQDGQLTAEIGIELDHRLIRMGDILIRSPELIELSFSQFYEASSVSQANKFRINGAVPSGLTLSEDGFSLTLELSQVLRLEEEIKVEAEAVQNKNQLMGEPSEILLVYEDGVSEFFAISESRLVMNHQESLNQNSFSISDFKLLESEITFSTEQDQDNNQIVLIPGEVFEENINYTLAIPPRWTVRGKLLHGSYRDFVWDATAPELTQVLIVSSQEIMLLLSEPLDPIYAGILSNYTIENQQPIQAQLQESGAAVLLKWGFNFIEGQTYRVTANQIADLAGNFSGLLSFDFTFELPPQVGFKSIIINEIMPAPRAGNTLPNVEYVELYNRSGIAVNLGGFQLANSRRTTTIPNEILLPNEYVILCPRTRVAEYAPYGRVIGLTNWPTLLNSADQLKLWDATDQIIDSLNYTTASFGGSAFASGGYSLEIVNPFIDCNISSNLKSSTSPARGTPGLVNAVFDESPDLTAPEIINARVIDYNQVTVTFSKILSPILQVLNIEFSPNLDLRSVELSPDQLTILLSFDAELKEGIKYEGKITGLRDCVGNEIKADQETFFFTIPSDPEAGDIVINEVLFNARTGGPKFVEMYNQSNKFINLKDWKLANLNSDGEIANRRVVSTVDLIIEPFSFLVFTTDSERLKSEYPKGDKAKFIELSTLPSYPQSQGNVVWLDPEEQFPEIFSYNERMHHRLLREPRGVSLERLSATAPVDQADNWQSASAAVGYASPGFKNSNTFEGSDRFGIEINPKVFVPDAAGEQNITTISYQVDQPGLLATLRIFATNGSLVREICQNEIWGTSGFYIWDGTDSSGRKVRTGYYILIADVFDLDGNVSQTKKTVIVGTKIR
ncbi:Lamin Tail Domain [Belliella buryatensis]|uniref:Lamin Tail Domain n=1 Tax=Belliella buryatensis TaxID=1500549 RepID=A0A239DMF2_9BACT|nr:lamin tail domain-containing protein [Belliella buryatensis]SNS33557.1 Lamin Tail Domain [Belliella buryatensis]